LLILKSEGLNVPASAGNSAYRTRKHTSINRLLLQ